VFEEVLIVANLRTHIETLVLVHQEPRSTLDTLVTTHTLHTPILFCTRSALPLIVIEVVTFCGEVATLLITEVVPKMANLTIE
jgi:hypothetical protein